MASTPTADERRVLRSWKEISAYLGVNARTAQRWEANDKLPVRRLGNQGKGRPFAYADELDEWLKRGEYRPAESYVPLLSRRLLIYISAAALVVILSALAAILWILPGRPETLAWDGRRFTAFDRKQRVAWTQELPGYNPTPLVSSEVVGDRSLISDIDGDQHKEVLVNYQSFKSSEGKLICFSDRGRRRWEFSYGAPRTIGERKIDSDYVGRFLRVVNVGDQRYILAVAIHNMWFPSQVVLLDSNGHVVDEYWHPGHILNYLMRDIDRDGIDELLMAAINNPGIGLGRAAVVVLKLPFSRSNNHATGPFTSFGARAEQAYILFPHADSASVLGIYPFISQFSFTADNRLLVSIPGAEGTALFYYLDSDLKVTEFRYSDNLIALHNRLHHTGLLHHRMSAAELSSLGQVQRFDTAPDGNNVTSPRP